MYCVNWEKENQAGHDILNTKQQTDPVIDCQHKASFSSRERDEIKESGLTFISVPEIHLLMDANFSLLDV